MNLTFEGDRFIDPEQLADGWSFENCAFIIGEQAISANNVDELSFIDCQFDGHLNLIESNDCMVTGCFSQGGLSLTNSTNALIEQNEMDVIDYQINGSYFGIHLE